MKEDLRYVLKMITDLTEVMHVDIYIYIYRHTHTIDLVNDEILKLLPTTVPIDD